MTGTSASNPNPPAKHGRLMIPNELDEAITYAPWRGEAQHKIVRALVRMTYGWRQRTVRVSVEGIAERCNLSYSGSFRRSLEDLVREGVVIRPERGSGAAPATYSINPDHEQWGRYTVGAALLARLFRERLPRNDEALASAGVQMGLLDRPSEGGQSENVVRPSEGEKSVSSNEIVRPLEGTRGGAGDGFVRPLEGTQLSGNSNGATSSEVLKDISLNGESISKTTTLERQTTTTTAADDEGEDTTVDYAIGLSTAANLAISKRWGEQTNPIHFGTGMQLAADMILQGVELEVARSAVERTVAKFKGDRPPMSLGYFREPILTAHRSEEQRRFDNDERGRRSHSGVERISTIVDPEIKRRLEENEKSFHVARRAAAIEWGKNESNAVAYAAIVTRAKSKFDAEFLATRFAASAVAEEILQLCEVACGFPTDVDAWIAVRAAS